MTSGDLAPRKPRRAEDWQGYRRPFPPRRAANTQWRGMRVHEAFPYRAAVTPIHPPSPAAATTASAASSSTLASSLFSRPSSQRYLSSCSIFYHHLYHRQHPAFRADPKTLQTERTRNECAATFLEPIPVPPRNRERTVAVESGREERGRERQKRAISENRRGGGKELGEGGGDCGDRG